MDARCRETLARCLPIVRRLLEPSGIRVVFLSGSAALGRAVGWTGDSDRFLLSDLDLGAITLGPVPPEAAADLRAALDVARSEDGPETTIGIYPQDALGRQVPTPGLVDLLAARRVLAGERRWLGRFPAADAESLPTWEAFRLVGNRCRELLAAGGVDGSQPFERRSILAMHRLAKLVDGIGTARLIAAGRYATDPEERRRRLESLGVAGPILDAHRRAQPFLESPSPATWPGLTLAEARAALVAYFRELGIRDAIGVAGAYEYDPRTVWDRLRAWRARGTGGIAGAPLWGWRAGFRGSPDIRELGAAVLYWLALPERPDPDWAPAAEPDDVFDGCWKQAGRLLGQVLAEGPGAKAALRRRVGAGETIG